MERRSTNKLFVRVSVNCLTIIRNDWRSVNVEADIGIQFSGDRRSRDARPSLTFSEFIPFLPLCAFIVDGAKFGMR